MIDVRLHRSQSGGWRLQVDGHNDGGCKGVDVVCAGVSALVQTSVRIDEVFQVAVEGHLDPGCTDVSFVAPPETRGHLDVVMSVLGNGFAAMAREHGSRIKFNNTNTDNDGVNDNGA